MTTSLPGPSSLGRIAACPQSEALEHVQSDGREARKGHVLHHFLAQCNLLGRDAALATVHDLDRAACEGLNLDRLPLDPDAYAPEVSFAWDPRTGTVREVGRMLTREQARAAAEPHELLGTADVVALEGDAALVVDWKTGRGAVDRAEVNLQIRTYGLFAARAYGRDRARVAIVRALDNGAVWFDWAELDALDLEAHEAELRQLLDLRSRILAGEERRPFREGEHCTYCPALPFCPAKMALLRQVAHEPGTLDEEIPVGALTPESAARAWVKLESATALIARLQAVVRAYARTSPVPMGDGQVLGERTITTEKVVPANAQAALVKQWGPQLGAAVFADAVEKTEEVTKKALDKALRKHVLPTLENRRGVVVEMKRATTEALREGRALSASTFQRVEVYRPKDEQMKEEG